MEGEQTMPDYAVNKPLSELFNIHPEDYTHVSIESLPFSVRVHKRLSEKHINSVKDLLLVDIAFLKNIRGFGVNCVNQVLSYCDSLAKTCDFEKPEQPVPRNDLFTANKAAIASGNFSFAENLVLSEDEKKQLFNIKEAFDSFGADLLYECVYSPEKIVPILKTLSAFSTKCSRLNKLENKLEDICSQIPPFRREKIAKHYIEAFSYDDDIRTKLSRCYSSPEEKLGAITRTIDTDDSSQVILAEKFLSWCI